MNGFCTFLSTLICIVGVLNSATGQNCVPLHQACYPGGPGCCQGYCQSLGYIGVCACNSDGYSCSSNEQCCNGFCNTRGTCGCIGYLGICNQNNDCCSNFCGTCQNVICIVHLCE